MTSDYLPCITNSIDDGRPCTIRGEHADRCDGWEWRFHHESECSYPTDIECAGCLPTPADHGLHCFSCHAKTREALKIAVDMITHLRSVERAQQIENAGVRASPSWVIPVPMTWRMADELIMLLGHPAPGFASTDDVDMVETLTANVVSEIDVDEWISRPDGAEAAVHFYRTMQHAMTQHPMADYEHRVRNVRCTDCRQRSLLWKPPLMFEGGIRIACTTKGCGFAVDDTQYAEIAAEQVVEMKSAAREKRAEQLAAGRKVRALLKRAAKAKRKAAEAGEHQTSEGAA